MLSGGRAPYPYDCTINGYGFIQTRTKADAGSDRTAPNDVDRGPLGPTPLGLGPWWGGIGHREAAANDELGLAALYDADSDTELVGAESSEGSIHLGYEVNEVNLDATNPVRAILGQAFLSKYWAASGPALYSSTTGDFSDKSLAYTAASNIRWLLVYGGDKGDNRLFLGQEYGPMVSTADGTTFSVDHPTRPTDASYENVGAVLLTLDGTNFTDYTTDVTGGAGTLPLDGLTTAGYVLVGFRVPFTGVNWQISASHNTNAATVAISYRNTSGTWTTVGSVSDDTLNGGRSLNDPTGTWMYWTRPAAVWARAVLAPTMTTGSPPAQALYWIKVAWSGTLSGTVRVDDMDVYANIEAIEATKVGRYFWIVQPDQKPYWTADGGLYPTWNGATQSLGSADASCVALVGANGAAYLKRTTDFASWTYDGSAVVYSSDLPELFNPPDTNADEVSACAFDNTVVFRHGARVLQFDPVTRETTTIGPERQTANERKQFTMTALHEDKHFLWGIGSATNGRKYLMKYGTYRWGVDQDGVGKWQRHDAWTITNRLRDAKRYLKLATYTNAAGQPVLVAGTADGRLAWVRLPKGQSPLESNSGCRYPTSDYGLVVLPDLVLEDRARRFAIATITVLGRNLSATKIVTVQAKGTEAADASFATLVTATTNAGQEISVPSPAFKYGWSLRVAIKSDDATVTPIVDGIILGVVREAQVDEEVLRFSILCEDNLSLRNGVRVRRRPDEWETRIETAIAAATPIALVDADGASKTVWLRQKRVDTRPNEKGRPPRRVVTLLLATST